MSIRKKLFIVSVVAAGMLLNINEFNNCHAQQFAITSPTSGTPVAGEVVEITGTGAAAANATIEIIVLTNQWYPQSGAATINADGTWTYAPCHLSGQGTFNNHTIKATLRDAQNNVLSTATVANIVRN